MSVIATFYDTTATILRDSTPSATSGDTTVTVGQVSCVIRPVDDKSRLLVESNFGKEFDMYCDDTSDIKVGDDVITDRDFDVKAVNKFVDLEGGVDSYLNVRLVAKR